MRSLITGLLPNFFIILFVGLFVLSFSASDARADATWKNLRGYSACGGIDQYGTLQPPCGFEKATYRKQSIKTCPKGSFADSGTCYTCPSGYNRTIRKITHERACSKPAPVTTTKAVYLGSGKCPSGSKFYRRNGGECWSCPSGFGRTAANVDKWNACGKIGKKAQAAIFKGRTCPEGSVRDPRNGGECWNCPEDYNRTGNPVTGAKACKTSFTFASAIEKSDLKCAPGQIFDFVDGGTCWTCPQGAKRTFFHGIKTAKACRNNKMKWTVPNRQVYGLFGLGTGADDILASLIAERSRIDAAIKDVAKKDGVAEATALKFAWDVIDNRPEESPFLSSMLLETVMNAARKPASARTESEINLLARVAQLIQWNRQFIAYQAEQAHETWVRASKASYDVALQKMGAAAIYSDSMVTPPDYNELVANSIQAGAAIAGPVGAVIVTVSTTSVKAALLPFRVAGAAARATATGAFTGSSAAAASVAPMMIAAAAAVIVTMEIDKFLKLEKAEGEIRQSIAIANRSVDIGVLLQQKDGPDELLFHWGAVIGEATKPSVNFKTRLAAYNSGTDSAASATVPKPSGTQSTEGMTSGTTSTELSGGLSGAMSNMFGEPTTEAKPLTAEQKAHLEYVRMIGAINKAVRKQRNIFKAPMAIGGKGNAALRVELSSRVGLCLSKKSGNDLGMNIKGCKYADALFITPNSKNKTLIFAEKYCLSMVEAIAKSKGPKHLIVETCNDNPAQKFELTSEGFIKQVNTNQCVTVVGRRIQSIVLTSKDCGSDRDNQIWRQWVGR